MKMPTLSLLTLLALGLTACSSNASGPNSTPTPTPEAGAIDAAAAPDATGPNGGLDAGAPADGSVSDATTSADAATGVDAAQDATATADAATASDAGAGADTGTVVDAGAGADATVVVDAGPPPPAGATCANALVITPPLTATYTTDATFGNEFTSGTGCFFKTGEDRVFAVDVPPSKRLYASVRGVGTFDPSVQIIDGASACDRATSCLAANDVGLATSLNFVAVTNSTAADKRYFVVVDGTDGGGQFEFRALIGDPLAGETCADAQVLTLGSNGSASLTAQTVDLYANDYTTGAGCTGFAGGERVYRLAIPANSAVAVTVTPEATFDAALNVIDGASGANPETACAAAITCSAGANVGGTGAQERVLLRNTNATPKTVFLTVDTAVSTSTPGTFDIAVESLPATPGDTCATLPRVTFANGSASFTNESLRFAFGDYGTGTTCVGTAGPDRGYAVEIPAGKILTVVATPTGTLGDGGASTLDLAMNLQTEAACTAASRTCLSGANATGAGAAERIVYSNGTTSAISAVLFVETNAATVPAPGTYDITFTLTDPPPGDTCASATAPIGPGTYPGQTLIGYQGDYGSGTGCSSAAGPDRLYLVRVPAGERLTATVTPDPLDGGTNWNPSINFMEPTPGCVATGRVCITGKDSGGTGAPESLFWNNFTGVDKDVFVVVETATTTAPAVGVTRGFTLDIAIAQVPPPPPGDVCSSATVVTPGTLRDQDLLGYANDYGSGTSCSPSFGTAGVDRTYRVTVPAGQRLIATVTPSAVDGGSNWDPVLNLQRAAGCVASGRTCLVGADVGLTGGAETARWINSDSTDVDVFVVVESYGTSEPTPSSPRAFDLTIALDAVAALPAGDACTDAQSAIATTTTLATESMENFTRHYDLSSCDSLGLASDGPDRTYRVTIAPGKTLTVTVDPSANLDPALAIVVGSASACTATLTCNGYSDTGLDGIAETVSYTNSGASPVNAFVVVGSWTPFGSPTYGYGITFTFTP